MHFKGGAHLPSFFEQLSFETGFRICTHNKNNNQKKSAMGHCTKECSGYKTKYLLTYKVKKVTYVCSIM